MDGTYVLIQIETSAWLDSSYQNQWTSFLVREETPHIQPALVLSYEVAIPEASLSQCLTIQENIKMKYKLTLKKNVLFSWLISIARFFFFLFLFPFLII